MIFVDTNYFLRFLLKDNLEQHNKAKALFLEGAQGEIRLFTSTIVFFEIYWVLSSFYKKEKKDIGKALANILDLVFIRLRQRNILRKAVAIYRRTNFDLEDSFNLVYAKSRNAQAFATFDEKLKRRFKRQRIL